MFASSKVLRTKNTGASSVGSVINTRKSGANGSGAPVVGRLLQPQSAPSPQRGWLFDFAQTQQRAVEGACVGFCADGNRDHAVVERLNHGITFACSAARRTPKMGSRSLSLFPPTIITTPLTITPAATNVSGARRSPANSQPKITAITGLT